MAGAAGTAGAAAPSASALSLQSTAAGSAAGGAGGAGAAAGAHDTAAADTPLRMGLLHVDDLRAEVSFQSDPLSRPR